MSDALPLLPRPNIDAYKRLAEGLMRASSSRDPMDIAAWAERWAKKLAAAGIIAPLYDSSDPHFRRRVVEYLRHRIFAKDLPVPGSRKFSLSDAQLIVARLHGFASWKKFASHVGELARANSAVSKFEAAADAIVNGEIAKLKRLLRKNPGLVRARSTRQHRSTLLHYVSANGIEDFRQKTPKNIVAITKVLLEAGADLNAESEAYGGGSTTLGLTATSCHPADAGVQIELMQALLDGGARLDQPSAAGNAQSIVKGCFANGQPQAAAFLASRGAPIDLEEAIALGRVDAVKAYFDSKGKLRRGASRAQLKAGFLHACGCGRTEMVRFLLDRGVDVRVASRHGETGLHWAAYAAHPDVAKILLQRGAAVNAVESAYGGTPLGWALYGWGERNARRNREGYYDVVRALVAAGANVDPAWLGDSGRGMPLEKIIRSDARMRAALDGKLK